MYDEKNEIIVNLRVPTNEYKDEDLQELINWSTLSNFDDGYFRNLAIYMNLNEKIERTIVFTHAYIRMNKKINTKADYVDIELIVNQRGDKFVGVVFGEKFEETLLEAKDRVANPPKLNIIVPIASKNKTEGLTTPYIFIYDKDYSTKKGVYDYIQEMNEESKSIMYPIPKKSVLEIRAEYEIKTSDYFNKVKELDMTIRGLEEEKKCGDML